MEDPDLRACPESQQGGCEKAGKSSMKDVKITIARLEDESAEQGSVEERGLAVGSLEDHTASKNE